MPARSLTEVIITKYGKMNIIPSDRIISHSLSLYGEWAGDELSFLENLLKPGMCVLDIGAFIGTHTLAFARLVGESGQVHSFEPRKEIYEVLCSNIEANQLKHVKALNMGLSDSEGAISLQSVDITENSNFGGLSIETPVNDTTPDMYSVPISTVDMLDVAKVDFMKLDVEGMERRVLEGATAVITRDQPIIFCECNSLSSGYEIVDFCKPHNYRAFVLSSPAYNPENFNGVTDNIFGGATEISLLLVPENKLNITNFGNHYKKVVALENIEDLVLPLLHKPQYSEEVLAHTNTASVMGLKFSSPLSREQSQIIDQKTEEIISLKSELFNLTESLKVSSNKISLLQEDIRLAQLDIQRILTSSSWRITSPLRTCMAIVRKTLRPYRMWKEYSKKRPGISGIKQLAHVTLLEFKSNGVSGVFRRINEFRQASPSSVDSTSSIIKEGAKEISELKRELEDKSLTIDTIIFDHNGGGGSNQYTSQLINSEITDKKTCLRIYFWESSWHAQLRINTSDDHEIYTTKDQKELFECLSISCADKIIINSLYGYKSIETAIKSIIDLKKHLKCPLDFKVHDFHALCPSPHLSNVENKYCGIPDDHKICKACLPKNLHWYHSWLNKDDIPLEIDTWREPFQFLFDSCDLITLFDESSADILRKDFDIDEGKIRVTPHDRLSFKCETKLSVKPQINIGVIGTLSHIKGGDVIKDLCSHIDKEKLRVPVTIIGESHTRLPSSAIIHGRYSANELPLLIDSHKVSVIFMASIVPETFSYTISEAIEMGLPVISFDIGAQGRRVKQYRLGKVVPLGASSQEILSAAEYVHNLAKV
jgi:FkbM family methyltransferase